MVAESSAEDKFPVAPPHPQPQKPDWLPKWLFESPGVVNNNAGGPPAQQPAEMVKFPSVTVLEPAGQVDGQKVFPCFISIKNLPKDGCGQRKPR